MAEIREIVERVITEADARGVAETTRALLDMARAEDELRDSVDAVTRSTEGQDRSAESVQRRYDRLRASIDAAYRAQQAYERDVRTLTNAQEQLGLSTEEVARNLALLQERHFSVARAAEAQARAQEQAARAARANAQMTGLSLAEARAQGRANAPMNMGALAGYSAMPSSGAVQQAAEGIRAARQEAQMLQYQMFDMGTMLAGGSSPFMIMATQGPQIAQQLGGYGVRGAITAMGTAFMGLLTPLNAAIAGVAGLAIGVGYLWDTWESGAPSVEDALKRQAELAKQLRDLYGEAAENAARVGPPNLPELRFMTGQNLATLQAQSITDSRAFLTEAGNWTRGGFMADKQFLPFAKQLSDFSKTVLEGRPAVEAFREQIVGMSAAAPEAAAKLLELAAGIRDVNNAVKTAAQQDFLAKLDPKALEIAARSGSGYGALNDALMRSRGIVDPNAPLPRVNPARDLGQDLTKLPGTSAADRALMANLLQDSDRRIAQLSQEAGLYSQGQQAVDAFRIAQEMQNKALADGIVLDERKLGLINQRAQQEAAAAANIRRIQEEQREAEREAKQQVEERRRQAEEDARFWETSMSGALKSLSRGGNPMEVLTNFGFRLGDKLIDEGLSGKGDILGGLLSFSRGKSAATEVAKAAIPQAMNASIVYLSAGSVVGMQGLGGLPGMGAGSGAGAGAGAGAAGSLAPAGAAPVGAVERGNLAPVYGQPPIPGLKQRPQFGLPPIPGLQRSGAGIDPRDVSSVIEAGAGYTTVQLNDGSIVRMMGARNWRNNNPGNIEYGKFARSQGAVGSDGRFAVFRDYDAGRAAKEALLFESAGYRGKTLEGAINRYAPPFENNTSAYANQVAQATGVPLNTPLSALDAQQRNAMLNAMQRVEGWRPGQMQQLSGPSQIPLDQVSQKFQNLVPPLQQMPPVLNQMQSAAQAAGGGLGQLGNILGGMGGGGSGGGILGTIFGVFGNLLGGGKANGGWIRGPGTARSDSVLTATSNGEYIVNAYAASRHGALLEAINSGEIDRRRRLADGGWGGAAQRAAMSARAYGGGGRGGGGGYSSSYRSGDVHISVQGNADRDTMNRMREEFRAELDARDKAMMEREEHQRENSWRYGNGG